MKIPRIKLPDKNLISLREFISGWRVNYHYPGLGWFKLNLGKTTTFPRSTFANKSTRWKTGICSLDQAVCVRLRLLRWCLQGATLRYGCCSGWRHWTRDIDGRRALSRQASTAQPGPGHFPSLMMPTCRFSCASPRTQSVRSLDQETSREMAANVPTVNKNIKGIYHGHSNISLPLSRKYFEQETSQNLVETRDTLVTSWRRMRWDW